MANFLGLEPKYSEFENSDIVIIPVPYEQTTSYIAGTKQGPDAIIDASAYVELYDEQLDLEIYKKGIHTSTPVLGSGNVEDDFREITRRFKEVIRSGKFPVGLGGEHSISFPAYRAFHESFENLSVLQLDAHSDLRASYEGSVYSHASVMRRILELNKNIVQVGIRSQCKEEANLIKAESIDTFYAHQIKESGFAGNIIGLLSENVFITIDVDFFDPSIMPSTGTPEPGGFLWYETLEFLKRVFVGKNVVGFDVVELSPQSGIIHPDFMTAKLIYKMLGFKYS